MPNQHRKAQPGKVCPTCGQIHQRCLAHPQGSKRPCGRPRMHGGYVCCTHGGRAPQTKRRAALRVLETLEELIDPERMLREAARIALFDPRKLFDAKGNLLPPAKWPDEVAAAVGGIEVLRKNITTGDGKTDNVDKVKIWDKTKALEMLFKHHNLYKEQVEHSGTVSMRWLQDGEDEGE